MCDYYHQTRLKTSLRPSVCSSKKKELRGAKNGHSLDNLSIGSTQPPTSHRMFKIKPLPIRALHIKLIEVTEVKLNDPVFQVIQDI